VEALSWCRYRSSELSAINGNTTWIFGCSSPLGHALLRGLPTNSNLLCFGRKRPDVPAEFLKVDLSQPDCVDTVLRHAFVKYPPKGVVFCQRYRPRPETSELEAIQQGLTVELGPLLSIMAWLESSAEPTPLRSVVLLSSVAGNQSHPDISTSYHVLKAATLAACRSLTNRLGPRGIRINCLVLGEFLKGPQKSYPDYKLRQFSEIEKFTLGRRICNLQDIFHAVKFLLSDDAAFVTGQELTLDGGVSLLGAESLIRTGVASK
jgi:NAD(P)-dependent dehydrogenase (short-subunit alcohol dehydrogenase family)